MAGLRLHAAIGMLLAASATLDVSDFNVYCGDDITRFQKICNSNVNTMCVVDQKVWLPVEWLKCQWKSSGSLVLATGAFIGCANRTDRCSLDPGSGNCLTNTCELKFSFDGGITLQSGSTIQAGTVELLSSTGRVVIAEGAQILANGTGEVAVASIERRGHLVLGPSAPHHAPDLSPRGARGCTSQGL